MGHPTAISDRCWCSALSSPWSRSSLLGSAPTGSFRCTAPKKKRDKKASLILSFSLTAGQPKPASFNWETLENGDKTRENICRGIYAAYLAFSDFPTWYWSFENTFGGVFRKGFWRMFNRFLVNFQGPGLILCPCRHSKTTPAWRWCW